MDLDAVKHKLAEVCDDINTLYKSDGQHEEQLKSIKDRLEVLDQAYHKITGFIDTCRDIGKLIVFLGSVAGAIGGIYGVWKVFFNG